MHNKVITNTSSHQWPSGKCWPWGQTCDLRDQASDLHGLVSGTGGAT